MTLEEETPLGDGGAADPGKATSVSGSEPADPSDITDPTLDGNPGVVTEKVEAEVNHKPDPKNPFEEGEEIVDDPEQTDEPSETEPLNAGAEARAGAKPSVGKDNGDIEGEPGLLLSREDLESPTPKKRAFDCRCVVVGLLILVIMVGGAAVAILAQKFKSPSYNFRFASYYGDHMVLQRAPHKAVVWGYGPVISDNTTVKVTLTSEDNIDLEIEYFTTVKYNGGKGVWKVLLGPISSSGPYILTAILVGQEGHVQKLHDVLFGDVWICAGEGNMQYSVGQLTNASEEIAAAEKYQNVRLFSASPAESDMPWYDLRGIQLHWSRPSQETLVGKTVPASQFAPFFPAVCWLYGKRLHERLKYPIGLITATYNSSLLDEWTSPGVLDSCDYPFNPSLGHSTSRVWNAMLHPLLDISVYGALWYQGESDALEMQSYYMYNCTLVKMFEEWRKLAFQRTLGAIDPTFPIGTVQLAPNRPDKPDESYPYGFTTIRWRQTANYGFNPNPLLKKVFTAVAIDLPDINGTHGSLHSTHKHEVVNRLVKGALAIAYQQKNITFLGPFPAKYQTRDSGASLTLYLTPTAHLETRSKQGFEVCCSKSRDKFCTSSFIKTIFAPDTQWEPAPITRHSSSSVTMDTSTCKDHVVGLRYAWRETPCKLKKCAVYDTFTSLPMPPYIKMGLIDDDVMHDLPQEQVNVL